MYVEMHDGNHANSCNNIQLATISDNRYSLTKILPS